MTMEFHKGYTMYHCWATRNGGLPYHDYVTSFPSQMSEEEVVDELENMWGPFSSGHRGFNVERIPDARDVQNRRNEEYRLKNAAEKKATARRIMDGINDAAASAEGAARLAADNIRGMGDDRDPKLSGVLYEAVEKLEDARDLLMANPVYQAQKLKEKP